jgi:hypothetical protein
MGASARKIEYGYLRIANMCRKKRFGSSEASVVLTEG